MLEYLLTSSNDVLTRLLRRFASGRPTHPILVENHKIFTSLDQNRSLQDFEFVILDTELTGLDAKNDEIVSIGAVRARDLRVDPSDTFYTLVRPKRKMPKVSTLIHRITPEEVKSAPPIAVVLPKLLEYLGNSLIVGHNVGLDMSFLNREIKRRHGAGLLSPCVDTLRLARAYNQEMWENYYDQYQLNVSFNLADLARQYEMPLFPAHNALQDAMQTAYLFLYLVRKMRKGGIETLKDLYLAGRTRRFMI